VTRFSRLEVLNTMVDQGVLPVICNPELPGLISGAEELGCDIIRRVHPKK
jgi:hypothetical protein